MGLSLINRKRKYIYSRSSFQLIIKRCFHHTDLSNFPPIQRPASDQYDGLVTNLNIFQYETSLDLQKLSLNLCEVEGTYLSWNSINFNLNGHVMLRNLSISEVCGSVKPTVMLPTETTIFTANDSCHLLQDGTISEFYSIEELKKLLLLETVDKYLYIWTPYSGQNDL